MCPCGCIGKRKKRSFIKKTLTEGSALLQRVIFSEDVATSPGWLQRLDPRVKLISMLVLLVAVGLVHHVAVLVGVYASTVVIAATSRLPVGFFIKRVWLFVPIFTGIVILPATLSIITPGDIVVQLWSWHGSPQGITSQGLTTAALVVTRVATSISLVILTTLTTPWVRLLAALRALGVCQQSSKCTKPAQPERSAFKHMTGRQGPFCQRRRGSCSVRPDILPRKFIRPWCRVDTAAMPALCSNSLFQSAMS
jgi:hypothetical protein